MKVMLIHGLYMNALTMYLGRRLQQAGFSPLYFDYFGTQRPLRAQAARLARFIQQQDSLPCHFVAHSLGGLLLRHLAAGYPKLLQGHVVTLGSPHQGSQAAQTLRQYCPPLIGAAWADGLDGNLPSPAFPVPCGNICGSKSIGLGHLLGVPDGDGTVGATETKLPESQVLTVPCTHNGLLWNKEVAHQIAYFLQHGHFQAA